MKKNAQDSGASPATAGASKARKARAGARPNKVEGLALSPSRAGIIKRLRRAEGQLRGLQRMVEEGESCQNIGQQFCAAIKALESTYMRMIVCFAEQDLGSVGSDSADQEVLKAAMLKNLEAMLANSR